MIQRLAAFALLAIWSSAFLDARAPQFECPRTIAPPVPFLGPTLTMPDRYWHGSETLAVNLPQSGKWVGMGAGAAYRDKLFWWSPDYTSIRDQPDLRVTARRLDRQARPLIIDRVSNASWEDSSPLEPDLRVRVTAMLHLMEFPDAGCWEVTGWHRAERLGFVVEVGE